MLPARGRRYLIAGLAVGALLGGYAAAGFLLVPRWVRSELTQLAASRYDRQVAVGEVRFNPFTLTLRVARFSFPDATGRPMLSFGHLRVSVGIASLWRLAPSFSRIRLDEPYVSVIEGRDGALNLAQLEGTGHAGAGGRGTPMRIYVDRLTVSDGSAALEDDSAPAPVRLRITGIGFELRHFATAGGAAGAYRLEASCGGGRIESQGTVSLRPLALRGALALEGLRAATLSAYVAPASALELVSGTVSARSTFVLSGGAPGAELGIELSRALITGLGLKGRGGRSDGIEVARIELRHARLDPVRRLFDLGTLTVSGAQIRGAVGADGRLDLLEPAAGEAAGGGGMRPASQPAPSHAPAAAPRAARAWRVAAPEIVVRDSRISLEDRRVRPAASLVLGGLSARIAGLDTRPGDEIELSLRASVNGSGGVRLRARANPGAGTVSGTLDLHRIDLTALQPYVAQRTALALVSGRLDTTLAFERAAHGRLRIEGAAAIADLRTVDDALRRDFIRWRDLRLTGIHYVSSPASLRIGGVTAIRPYARVIVLPDRGTNIAEALHPRGFVTPAGGPKAPRPAGNAARHASAATRYSIGTVRILDGTADYADLWIRPHFATGIQALHGTITGLSSDPRSRATVRLAGMVDRYAPVHIDGRMNLLASPSYADLRLSFRGLELTQMTPYAARFAGYRIASGTLDADMHYRVENGRLNADHQFVINQLVLGQRVASPEAVNLPLRLAVALLKDAHGVIRIGLPVTGSLSDPHFSIGPLIEKALLSLVRKAVTAPFRLLGRLFGGGPNLDRIEFAPGSSALGAAARMRLAAIAKALVHRPELRVSIPVVFSPARDRPALAARAARKLGARERALASPKAARSKRPTSQPAVLESVHVPTSELLALGKRRATAIRSALLATPGIAGDRVTIVAGPPQPCAACASAAGIAVALGLK
jgi:hypothetical protein